MKFNLEQIKEISILDYLQTRGIQVQKKGNKMVCKSPLHKDSSWSLVIYPQTNSFYDWSAGFGGTIVDLVMAMEGLDVGASIAFLAASSFQKFTPNYKSSKVTTKRQFEYTRYLTTDPKEIEAIKAYANSRRILGGFEYGVFHAQDDNGSFQRVPSIMFLHRSADGEIIGAKFRVVDPNNNSRFSSRGVMEFYILEYVDLENYGAPTLYVVEGEANANSLWQYCQDIRKNCVVVSFGGVGNLPISLPTKYKDIQDKRLIIDYDGDEKAYDQRISRYTKMGYGLSPLKLILEKGNDINRLYVNNQMELIRNLIL